MSRTSPCFDNPLLSSFDDTLRRRLSLVLNVELDDKQWSQATLPVHMGGLGVTSACMLASSAFLASAAATLPLQDAILAESVQSIEDHTVTEAKSIWIARANITIPTETKKHVQKAWDTPNTTAISNRLLDDDFNTLTDWLD